VFSCDGLPSEASKEAIAKSEIAALYGEAEEIEIRAQWKMRNGK
jgi:hypothetical protein